MERDLIEDQWPWNSCIKMANKYTKYMNSFCSEKCLNNVVDGKLQCKCGEEYDPIIWYWEADSASKGGRDTANSVLISSGNRDVIFHPVYSSGTAAVRGSISFKQNMHYYWEIKIISNLYGTDVMVGIGTPNVGLSAWKINFCSMLGIDCHSWGYSYLGMIQHNGLKRKYGSKFNLGSIVGVHLDLCRGTLEFYLNRKPLGIAFRNLKGLELYPMVSSTAAQSAVRINCATEVEESLQLKCLQFIINNPKLYKLYRDIPGLSRIYEKKYFWIMPVDHEADEKRKIEKLEAELFRNSRKKRKGGRLHMVFDERIYKEVCVLSSESETDEDADVDRLNDDEDENSLYDKCLKEPRDDSGVEDDNNDEADSDKPSSSSNSLETNCDKIGCTKKLKTCLNRK